MPFKFGTNRISTGGDITTGTPVHVDVTAVTPLIAHNNIISLEIDNHTIKVNDDGLLTADLSELGNEVNSIAGDVALMDKNKANINLSNISDAGKLVIKANAGIPENMVTTNTEQTISGAKTFNNLTILNNELNIGDNTADRQKLILKGKNATLEVLGADYTTDEATTYFGSSMSKTVIRGTEITDVNNNEILTTANLPLATVATKGAVKPDGKTIMITDDGTISTNHIESVGEKYGIRGDYSTQYGILECPNGILTVDGMNVTLKYGVIMQCAGQEAKTMVASDMKYTITSTSDIDLFYAGGQLLECGDVYYQEDEPENGTSNYIAWWKPTLGKWQFKSNDTGNVFRPLVACRLAHIHTNGETITRVDYIGNRILDDEIFALKSDLDTVVDGLPKSISLLQGASLYPISSLATNATQTQIIQKINEIIALLVSRGVARIQ